MEIEVKEYTYEDMPEFCEPVEGAEYLVMSGEEIKIQYFPHVVYAHPDGIELYLQIFMPEVFNHPDKTWPCILFIQGSAWKEQNLYHCTAMLPRLAALGYVIAIVQYRHSGLAQFPAQIQDAQAAYRFLVEHAAQYHINPDQMFFMGDSSGGQVALLAGMGAKRNLFDVKEEAIPIDPKGILSMYGAMEVTLPYGFPTTRDHQKITSPEGMMMGFDIAENPEKGAAGNALSYIDEPIPPIFLIHGTKDRSVFCQQSVNLYNALKEKGKPVELVLLQHADHGGAAFWTEQAVKRYDQFFQQCLHRSPKENRD